jgi:CheY-like chemotaxis protein
MTSRSFLGHQLSYRILPLFLQIHSHLSLKRYLLRTSALEYFWYRSSSAIFDWHSVRHERYSIPVNATSNEHAREVLIVDDEPELCSILETFLAAEGYRCQRSASVEEAWGIVHSRNVHCILLDVNLPGQSGIEMLKPLREQYPNIPVVLMTVKEDAATMVEAVDFGVHGYLPKPFKKRELIAVLSGVFSNC